MAEIDWTAEDIAKIHDDMNRSYFSKNEEGNYDIYKYLAEGFKEIISQESQFPLTCIDLGCGAGWQAVYLYKIGFEEKIKYIGIDISKYMCERGEINFPQGKFIVSNINDFTYEPQHIVMSCGFLEPFLDWKPVFQKHLNLSKKWVFIHKIFTTEKETNTIFRTAYKDDAETNRVYININELFQVAKCNNYDLHIHYEWDGKDSFIFKRNE